MIGREYYNEIYNYYDNVENDKNAIELIDNQLIPIFERQLEELVIFCREFYAARAHIEG